MQVVLAANEVPSINDVTVEELMGIVTAVCEVDPLFAAHSKDCTFRVVSSGNDLPVIDLSKVTLRGLVRYNKRLQTSIHQV